MTIVANNSLTISNVNDGTITHTAWSYSADGTDRFTVAYPNLNLLTNSRLQSGNIAPFSSINNAVLTINTNVKGLNVSCSGGAISYMEGVTQGTIPVSAGNQYAISAKVINNGTVTIDHFTLQFQFYDSSGTSRFQSKNLSIPADGKVNSFLFTSTAPANAIEMRIYYLDIATSANVAHYFTIYDMKVEQGLIATPWMPSASEVTTTDCPSYLGQYTDVAQSGSNTPSDYTWSLIRGSDGVSPTVTINPDTSLTIIDAQGTSTTPVLKGSDGTNGTNGTNGQDAISVVLSNENVTLPANAQGGVTSYANSNTTIGVTYGSGVDLTPVASGATLANNQFKVTTSASNITAGDQTVDTINKKINYAVASGMNATSGVVASITYTISICNSAGVTSTVTKIQNFSKAEKGITGDKGIDSYTYIRYSASSNGANMTSLPDADSQYIGTCTTTQATAPTTEANYVWAKFVGANGAKGDSTGITRSTTEPTTRYTGMLWQYTGTVNLAVTGITALPSSLYVWTGSAWQLYLVKSTNLQVDNGFITNAMIANAEIDNAKIKDATIESAKIKSINADKIAANSLAAISAILGDVTAGTYTSWNFSDSVVYNYLNGVYLYDGHLRSIAIENSTVTDPNKNLTSKSYLIRGSDVYGGMVTFFNNTITTSAKPNDLLKGSSFFNGSNQASVLDSSRDASGASALDIRSDNVRITGYASQTIPWTKLTDFAYYKVMFGRVNVRVGLTSGSSRDDIYLGTVPDKYKSPNGEMMLPAQAWSIGADLDRHVQYSSNGSLYLLNPEPNTKYVFEVSYTL